MNAYSLVALSVTCWISACGALHSVKRSSHRDAPIGTWGHLNSQSSSWLAQLKPGAKLSVCGDFQTQTASAIKVWATAAKRADHLKISDTCDSTADKTITVLAKHRQESRRECTRMPKTMGFTFVDQGLIVLCDSSSPDATLLHETGHLWGLCDVYPKDDLETDNCDPNFFTGRNRHSVMGANFATHLAPADQEGMRQLMARGDLESELSTLE